MEGFSKLIESTMDFMRWAEIMWSSDSAVDFLAGADWMEEAGVEPALVRAIRAARSGIGAATALDAINNGRYEVNWWEDPYEIVDDHGATSDRVNFVVKFDLPRSVHGVILEDVTSDTEQDPHYLFWDFTNNLLYDREDRPGGIHEIIRGNRLGPPLTLGRVEQYDPALLRLLLARACMYQG